MAYASGNLCYQIEHHLFPDPPSNRYPADHVDTRSRPGRGSGAKRSVLARAVARRNTGLTTSGTPPRSRNAAAISCARSCAFVAFVANSSRTAGFLTESALQGGRIVARFRRKLYCRL